MPLTEEHSRLAMIIERHVQHTLANSGSDGLLVSLYDDMGVFKQLLDTCSPENMDILCERHDGCYRFAKTLEHLAQSIADGGIPE